jgi:hypothetical protein
MSAREGSRIAFLRERVASADASRGRTTFDVPFRQRQIALVKIDVPLDFPLYNIGSGRTHRAQSEWIERHGKFADFFVDPEEADVQLAQHQILHEMIEQEGLAADLERRQQRNPIVLTFDGFVIDGNRRICALREQGDAENVSAVVLPQDATRPEIYETELELQMARETRARYNWIDQALHVHYGVRELGENPHAVAQRMNVQDGDIEAILRRLALVDLFLDWLGMPRAYHRVPPESEQAFIELGDRETRQQFRSMPEARQRAARLACFAVIRHEGGGYMDVRRVADSIRNTPTDLVSRVRERLPDDLRERLDDPIETSASEVQQGDLLSELAASEDQASLLLGAELLNVVERPEDAAIAAPILIDVAEEIADEQRDVQGQLEPLRKIERALKLMQSVRIADDTRRLDKVAERLADVVVETDRLTTEVTRQASETD